MTTLKFGDKVTYNDRTAVYLRPFPMFPCLEDIGALIMIEGEPVASAVHRDMLKVQPAQQHYDDLLALARATASIPAGHKDLVNAARNVLDMIDPPKPPTLEEVLGAMQAVMTAWSSDGAVDHVAPYTGATEILNRARRSGVMK